jgi:hypothetical protein
MEKKKIEKKKGEELKINKRIINLIFIFSGEHTRTKLFWSCSSFILHNKGLLLNNNNNNNKLKPNLADTNPELA